MSETKMDVDDHIRIVQEVNEKWRNRIAARDNALKLAEELIKNYGWHAYECADVRNDKADCACGYRKAFDSFAESIRSMKAGI